MIDLIFDTETTGKYDFKLPFDHSKQPDLIQFALLLADGARILQQVCLLVKPDWHYEIDPAAEAVHGISRAEVDRFGVKPATILGLFDLFGKRAERVVAHNLAFDAGILRTLAKRAGFSDFRLAPPTFCTMHASTSICKIPGQYGGFKWPKLSEAYFYFGLGEIIGAHNAMADALACHALLQHLDKREEKDDLAISLT